MAGEGSVLIGEGTVTEDEVAELSKIIDDKGEVVEPPKVVTPPADEPPADEDIDLGEGDDHDDEERSARVDEELEGAANDAEREAIRARRRQERKDKRQRARDKIQSLERKLSDERSQRLKMQKQLDQLVQTNHSGQIAQLQGAEAQADGVIEQLEAAKAQAVVAQDGMRVVEADRKINEVREYKKRLVTAREQATEQARQMQQKPSQHLDPDMVNHAATFRKENPWFQGVGANDEHSKIISAIDNQMFSEGWDPSSPAYWTELRKRGAKYLPDRFKGGAQSAQARDNPGEGERSSGASAPRRSPVAGGNSGATASSGGGGKTNTTLSPARVQAMKDSGNWSDIKKRNAMIREYQEYDRTHKS